MFQLFLRARAHNLFTGRSDDRHFKARSADRDIDTDRSRVGSILGAIEHALREAEQEQSGLNRRVEDVLARAAVTVGNAADEYLDREALDSRPYSVPKLPMVNAGCRSLRRRSPISGF